MRPEPNLLPEMISDICKGNPSAEEINRFANLCIKIAVAYLRILEVRGQRIRETGNQNELQGIASDCIADLFAQNNMGGLPQLQLYFESYVTKNRDSDELLMLLRQLLSNKVRQHLTKIFAQRDPEGAKLIRNIRLSTERFDELQINRDSTGEFIAFINDNIPPNKISRPDYFDLQKAFSLIFRANYSVDRLVFDVLKKLSDDFECFVEVKILDLVKLIREYRLVVKKNEFTETEIDPLYHQKEIELKKKVIIILDRLNQKITEKYITKGKITLDEGIAISKALKDMAKDAMQGERLQENFYYLQRHWSSITREEYFASVRKIFEYFVRLFKDEVRKKASENSE